jgi:hypothetical protein
MVEFTLLLPLLLALAIGLLEFGMLFKDAIGINYASRTGARVGVTASKRDDADCHILKAISTTMRTMEYDRLVRIEIYRANNPDGTCGPNCLRNTWIRAVPPVLGDDCVSDLPGPNWYHPDPLTYPPNQRENRDNTQQGRVPDGLGIAVEYKHQFFFNYVPGAESIVNIRDVTVMQIEPPEFRPVPP